MNANEQTVIEMQTYSRIWYMLSEKCGENNERERDRQRCKRDSCMW